MRSASGPGGGRGDLEGGGEAWDICDSGREEWKEAKEVRRLGNEALEKLLALCLWPWLLVVFEKNGSVAWNPDAMTEMERGGGDETGPKTESDQGSETRNTTPS